WCTGCGSAHLWRAAHGTPAARSGSAATARTGRPSGGPSTSGHVRGSLHDVVDEAVFLRLVGGEPPVAVGVTLDLVDGLAGLLGDQAGHLLLDVQHLLGLDLDVRGRATDAA